MNMSLRAAILVTAIAASPAVAQEAPYLDDRSDPVALVRSLYNAVNRKEYARAWDYFGDSKPVKSFDAFVDGYADTARVTVETGAASAEGAAGSTIYQVPVAILATGTDGSERVFAGCFTARLANPQVQGIPFRPLHLEKGMLKPADAAVADAVPASCGDGPAPEPRDAAKELAKLSFATTYGPICQTASPDAEPGAAEPQEHTIPFRYSYDSEDEPERSARLFRFSCNLAAYNSAEIYYIVDGLGDLRQLQFASPELDIRYENDDTDGKVESVRIIGYRTDDQLVNSFFDEATRSLTSAPKWRGVGDASSTALYIFRDGEFALVKYDVDASYDGEINPETVLDFDMAP